MFVIRRLRDGSARAVALVLLAAALAGCDGSSTSVPAQESASVDDSSTIEYAPGLTTDVYLPEQTKTRVPLVVLVPGGSWATADPTGLVPLAARLADEGIVAAPVHIRAAEDDVTYPAPLEDVLCAVAAVDEQARSEGFVPGPVTVLGHSSGAHLAALAVLAVADYTPSCGSPVVVPDALIGLSGPYDISRLPDVAVALLGRAPDEDPASWESANPVERADLRPDVPVLLLHGEDDEAVPTTFTSQFAEALEDAGHPTTVEIVPGASHLSIFQADVVGEPVAEWLQALPAHARQQ